MGCAGEPSDGVRVGGGGMVAGKVGGPFGHSGEPAGVTETLILVILAVTDGETVGETVGSTTVGETVGETVGCTTVGETVGSTTVVRVGGGLTVGGLDSVGVLPVVGDASGDWLSGVSVGVSFAIGVEVGSADGLGVEAVAFVGVRVPARASFAFVGVRVPVRASFAFVGVRVPPRAGFVAVARGSPFVGVPRRAPFVGVTSEPPLIAVTRGEVVMGVSDPIPLTGVSLPVAIGLFVALSDCVADRTQAMASDPSGSICCADSHCSFAKALFP